ncbi:MAG TPA: hypothetical protein VFC44_17620, partial [Candidatus Saccharimonadales bacterium]|nr:hypothetical protein [Candidatus Saccharimonadales bacterium]
VNQLASLHHGLWQNTITRQAPEIKLSTIVYDRLLRANYPIGKMARCNSGRAIWWSGSPAALKWSGVKA